jgi:hypothetical protein
VGDGGQGAGDSEAWEVLEQEVGDSLQVALEREGEVSPAAEGEAGEGQGFPPLPGIAPPPPPPTADSAETGKAAAFEITNI